MRALWRTYGGGVEDPGALREAGALLARAGAFDDAATAFSLALSAEPRPERRLRIAVEALRVCHEADCLSDVVSAVLEWAVREARQGNTHTLAHTVAELASVPSRPWLDAIIRCALATCEESVLPSATKAIEAGEYAIALAMLSPLAQYSSRLADLFGDVRALEHTSRQMAATVAAADRGQGEWALARLAALRNSVLNSPFARRLLDDIDRAERHVNCLSGRADIDASSLERASLQLAPPAAVQSDAPVERRQESASAALSSAAAAPLASPIAVPAQRVSLGASGPKSAGIGSEFVARLRASVSDKSLRRKLREAHRKSGARGDPLMDSSSIHWTAGTRATVKVHGTAFEYSAGSDRMFTWTDADVTETFTIRVRDDARPGSCPLNFDIYIEGCGFPVVQLRLEVSITPDKIVSGRQRSGALAPRSGFVSYSTKDRAFVERLVSAMRADSKGGLDLYMSVQHMLLGARWRDELLRQIQARDALYLCWSEHASESDEVAWEWKQGLAHGKEIMPRIVGEFRCDTIPKELCHLHFGDCLPVRGREHP